MFRALHFGAKRLSEKSQKIRRATTTANVSLSSSSSEAEAVKHGKAHIHGVQLSYEVRGSGSHPIVCIPGTLGTIESDFRPQLDYFGREGSGFTIVAFDPRGYVSSRPAERFKKGTNFFRTEANDAHALMQELSMPRYSVLGWSFGGIASLILAASFPQSVQKLVAMGATACMTKDDIEQYVKTRNISTWSARTRDPLVKIYGDSLQDLWSEWMDSLLELHTENDGDICKRELSSISCPTLIVHGAKDLLVPSFHPEYLRDHVTGSRLEVFVEGYHNLHLQYHQEFNKLVEDFLRE